MSDVDGIRHFYVWHPESEEEPRDARAIAALSPEKAAISAQMDSDDGIGEHPELTTWTVSDGKGRWTVRVDGELMVLYSSEVTSHCVETSDGVVPWPKAVDK